MNMRSGTILRRLLLSLSVVSVPLALGLLSILYLVDDFSRLSRSTVDRLTLVLESGDGLVESVVELERSASEYLLLGEQPFLQRLQKNHEEFRAHLRSLSRIDLDDDLNGMIAVAGRMESDLFSAIIEDEKPAGADTREAIRDLAELRDLSRRILARSSSKLGREVMRLQRSGETNVQVVGLLVIGLFVFTFLLAVGLTIRLSRPIGAIDTAIQRMGRGDFEEPIEVGGPRDLKELACRLEWLRRRLREIEREKETFLLHMSHELKSPVTSLHEGVGLLNEQLAGPLNSKQQEIARIMFENIHYLRSLIDNYVNYHALAVPARPAVNRRFRLNELAERVIGAIRQTGRHKALTFDVDLLGIEMVGDPERMRLVLTNLLSNAVKFSPAGSTVSLKIGEGLEGVVMEVADSGPGIPEEEREKVFEPFFQGAASFREHIQGNGLGLAIVREYVSQYGGRISVIARNPGTLFKVVIPKTPGMSAAV